MVVTLGTGVGTALFYEGKLLPHLEFAHHAFRKDQTYNEALGDAVRKQLGAKKWNKRVAEMIEVLRALTFFDNLYIGGTGLKASVLDGTGEMERDRVRIDTPYPLAPEKLVHVLTDLVKPLGHYDRVSVGFPGMVREGKVLSAPHFVSPTGPGG